MPYKSKEAFLQHGMKIHILHIALDCSICREPLAVTLEPEDCTRSNLPAQAVLSMSHTAVNVKTTDDAEVPGNDPTVTLTDDSLEPEHAVRISPCNHTFGRTCLKAWSNTSKSNRCPECNRQLFPRQRVKLAFRQPTLMMRLDFAKFVEEICGDSETAADIRTNPMSDTVRMLIREFAMEMWRRDGFDVEYEYIDDTEADDEEAETEVEDNETGDEDNETEDKNDCGSAADEMETDDDEDDDRTQTEYGFVKKA